LGGDALRLTERIKKRRADFWAALGDIRCREIAATLGAGEARVEVVSVEINHVDLDTATLERRADAFSGGLGASGIERVGDDQKRKARRNSSVSPLPIGMGTKAVSIAALFLNRYPSDDQISRPRLLLWTSTGKADPIAVILRHTKAGDIGAPRPLCSD
jgi:hypothetical protein